jgi:pimeloyl-ACP methyl ester carboxylesterase
VTEPLDRKRVQVSGGELAYVDEGDGPAVLLLHGFPTSAHLWRDLVPMLAPRFRAVAPDLLGYGDSDKPGQEAVTVRSQADHVRDLLDALGLERVAVVGHDIGGGIAQLLAFEGLVESLVLIDSICLDSWPIEGVRMIQQADPATVDEEFVANLVSITFDLGMGHPARLQEEDREEFVRPWRSDPPALIRAARGIDGVGLVGTEEQLASLDTRTLIVWGEDDPFQPSDLAERLGELLPGSTVALLPGCSHFVTEDAPEAVLPLISEYLRTHYLGERHGHAGPTMVDLGVSLHRPDPGTPAEEDGG